MNSVAARIPPLAGRLWLVGALALVVSPHLLRLPVWLGGACAAVIGWRALKELRGWPLPNQWLRFLLTVAAVGAVVLAYRSVVGREAGVAVLTVLVCLKLIEMKTLRDSIIVLFLGYFMAVGAFLFSQSPFMGAYMFAVVLTLTTALVAIHHPAGSLALSRGYLRTAGAMLVQALPVMLLLFVFFPRISGPLWRLPEDSEMGRIGLGEDMTIGAIAQLAGEEGTAFRVDFEGEMPQAAQLYWRGPVLWKTDGRRWEQLPGYLNRVTGLSYGEASDPVGYTVTLEPHDRVWLLALDLPATVPEGASVGRGYELMTDKPVRERLRYRMQSYRGYDTGPLDARERELATQLPRGVNDRTVQMGRQWRAQGLRPEQVVVQALEMFRRQDYHYTLAPGLLLGPDPLDEFLFETRVGFCEHYAAAFTLLMRAAGVPARVVTGYQGGERNPVGGYLLVKQSDAHAWAEVWLEQEGWARVDPTSVIPPERVDDKGYTHRFRRTEAVFGGDGGWLGDVLMRTRQSWDALNHGWNQWVLGFDNKRQAGLMKRLGLEWLDAMRVGVMLVGVLTIMGIVLLGLLLRQQAVARDPVARVYGRFCAKLKRRGLVRMPGEGPYEFALRVVERLPLHAEAVRRITEDYVLLRYGEGGSKGRFDALRREVRAFRP